LHNANIETAPLVAEVKPNWHTIRFNGSFFHENIYRKPPSDEVDAAWTALGIDCKWPRTGGMYKADIAVDRSVIIPESEANRTRLRPDQVKVSKHYGGGFPANVEGLHHLHCLLCSWSLEVHGVLVNNV
jgi:hypothetical protein